MSDRPEHLCLGNLTDYYPRVYLTEQDYPRMTCFQLDGRMVYQYQDKELNRPNGIYVDSAGKSCIYQKMIPLLSAVN